jgi:pimeloyl-ACP methyl ester carboxylesterase
VLGDHPPHIPRFLGARQDFSFIEASIDAYGLQIEIWRVVVDNYRTSKLLNHTVISERVFYPRSTAVKPSLMVEAEGNQLACHVLNSHPGAGWVVYFHGNGELAVECAQYFGDLFNDLGINICFAEYRGYGASSGEPALAAMLGDGVQVVAALGVPAERVVAFGRSLGSLYAIELAHRLPSLGGLVIESGIAVLNDIWPLGLMAERIGYNSITVTTELAEYFDHQTKLGDYSGPLLVLHAAKDHIVAQSHAERIHAWGGGHAKRLVVFPRGDHSTIFPVNYVEYLAELRTFLQNIGLAS